MNKKLLLGCILVIGFFTNSLAQDAPIPSQTPSVLNTSLNNKFVGVWEFLKPQQQAGTPFFTTLKVFGADSTCKQMRVTDKGTYMSQQGSYEVLDSLYFNDILTDETTSKSIALAGKTYKVRYKFITDQGAKLLLLEGVLEGKGNAGYAWRELWRKVETIKNATRE